jgi:cytoskeleton protein RodZ
MDNSPDTFTPDAPTEPFSLGRALRVAREARGLTTLEVAQQIKFAPRQIEALEAEHYAQLPELAFVRGFVRSYARLLQMDAQPLLAALPRAVVATPEDAPKIEAPLLNAQMVRRQLNLRWLLAALLVALILAAFSVWQGRVAETVPLPTDSGLRVSEPVMLNVATEAVSAPVVAQAVNVPAVAPITPLQAPLNAPVQAASSLPLRLVFDEESWAEVKDATGNVLLEQRNARGSEKNLTGAAPYFLVIGHAKGVRVFLRDQPVDLAPHTIVDVARLTLE